MKRLLLCLCLLLAALSAAGTWGSGAHAESPEWWWKKDRTSEQPPLRGGPEKEVRDLTPVNNNVLAAQYPDLVFVKGPGDQNRVALTFDDGPDPDYTPLILDVLNEFDVPGTFFLMGARATANPDLTRRVSEEGHEIGNHTYWHPDLVEEGDVEILVDEVQRTEETIADILGFRTRLFRAPYGFLYEELVEELGTLDYSIIAWDVDSLDWEDLTPEQIAENVTPNVEPGSIILMHDGGAPEADRTETAEALREIIPELREQGYEFVTVSELLNVPATMEEAQ
ncbi:polysaccharide deacetylase family protein [Alteribacter natronophilus]|uniref:polysaccharide deacetylase family protein n=1 Tax=Alteribacter natronophilus TaxID=2583810 RepID=UPI00110DE781|nr:polysaccharide deacetylase family protein [Alteribacter natronophilus]TMW73363.1 polysaccharide deacetylase family protein [Alteribacter natronophilus]